MSDFITIPPRYIDEDVAPVIHAYPEDYLDRYKCSNCKVEIEGCYMHYCYNCGALLD